MASLFNIQLQYAVLMELIEEAEGEITEEIGEQLNQLEENRDEFIESLCKKIANLEGFNHTIDAEIERLSERKADNKKAIEATKQTIIKVMKHFNMKSPNKKSNGYAFKTALFSGYTREVKSVDVDNALLINLFKPIDGEHSKYVKYSIGATVDRDDLLKLNELEILPVTSYNPTVDKKSAKEYLEAMPQSHEVDSEESVGIELDPIVKIASISKKDSLTIK